MSLDTHGFPEYVPFPLYHGTSSIWEESIRTNGLGSRRILEELQALEFHRRARACLDHTPPEWPVGTVLTMERIEAQSVTGGGFNFRHGGPYLTPSRQTAIRYAVHNPFGSELLTYCHLLYEAHANSGDKCLPKWFEEYPHLISVLKSPGQPLLVCVRRVRLAQLTDECGDSKMPRFSWLMNLIAESEAERVSEARRVTELREAIENQDQSKILELISRPKKAGLSLEQILETVGQQVNFEARTTIPAEDLDFEHIQTTDAAPHTW